MVVKRNEHVRLSNYFRMISLYYATKTAMHVKGSNVDESERLRVLTTFKDWLTDGYKKRKRENLEFKNCEKDILLTEIQIEIEQVNAFYVNDDKVSVNVNIVYYIAGYLVLKFKKKSKCQEC